MYESFSRIIQIGNFATACVKFSKKFTARLQDDPLQRFNALTLQPGLILFAFVFFRNDAIVHGVRMKHYRAEVKEKEAQTPPGRCERGQQHEKPDWDCAKHPEKTCEFVSLINVSQPGNDT